MKDKYYIVYGSMNSEDKKIGTIAESDLVEWMETDGVDNYNQLKIVRSDGQTTEFMLSEEDNGVSWDIISRGTESVELHEKTSFKNFSKQNKDKTAGQKEKKQKDGPIEHKHHHLKPARGANRKNQNYIPLYRQIAHKDTLPTAQRILTNAKKASSGVWKISKRQVLELAGKYKFNIPTASQKTKHLGSTGILMWRKNRKDYFLVKFSKHHFKG